MPKAVVLLTTIIPSLVTKLLTPTFLHLVPYNVRIIAINALAAGGMLLVALTPSFMDLKGKSATTSAEVIGTKMAGIALSSIASSVGEVTFLGLTHFYGPTSLAGWGSGTGAAGLVGAGAYSVATTGWGFSSREALFASSFLPLIMLLVYFLLLPRGPLDRRKAIPQGVFTGDRLIDPDNDEERLSHDENRDENDAEDDTLLISERQPCESAQGQSFQSPPHAPRSILSHLRATLHDMRPLFLP